MYDLTALESINYLEEPSLEKFSISETLNRTLDVIKQPFTNNEFLDKIYPIKEVERDYIVIRDREVSVPTGLKGNYLNYVKALEDAVLSIKDFEERILQPHIFFLSMLTEDNGLVESSKFDTSRYKPLPIDKLMKDLNSHLENNRKRAKGLVKVHFKNNNEIVSSSKIVVGINELLVSIDIDKIQKDILEIAKLTNSLNIQLAGSTYKPSKAFKKTLARVTLLTAKEATFISTVFYNYMVVHTSYIKMQDALEK